MAGRPINDNLATAKITGDRTYEGSVHAACGTTTRYTSGGGCVACARAKQTRMREALAAQAGDQSVGQTHAHEDEGPADLGINHFDDPVEETDRELDGDEGPAYKEPWD